MSNSDYERSRPQWMNPKVRRTDETNDENLETCRSTFHIDSGIITHSLVFKRLAHKTQVYALETNDHIRTRLTHSLEAGNIGRQIARYFVKKADSILEMESSEYAHFKEELEELTFAACLSHDLGHPPFGHRGTKVLQSFEERSGRKKYKFDDNKQVIRIFLNNPFEEKMNVSGSLIASCLKKSNLESCCYPSEEKELKKILGNLGLINDS